MSDKRQKNQLVLAFADEGRSEAPTASEEGTESPMVKRGTESLAIGEQLMEEVCERENCKQALKRVKGNKGSKPFRSGCLNASAGISHNLILSKWKVCTTFPSGRFRS